MPKQTAPPTYPKSIELFRNAPEEHQKLVRAILMDERKVQHLQRRSDIHNKIYEHVRRLIK